MILNKRGNNWSCVHMTWREPATITWRLEKGAQAEGSHYIRRKENQVKLCSHGIYIVPPLCDILNTCHECTLFHFRFIFLALRLQDTCCQDSSGLLKDGWHLLVNSVGDGGSEQGCDWRFVGSRHPGEAWLWRAVIVTGGRWSLRVGSILIEVVLILIIQQWYLSK